MNRFPLGHNYTNFDNPNPNALNELLENISLKCIIKYLDNKSVLNLLKTCFNIYIKLRTYRYGFHNAPTSLKLKRQDLFDIYYAKYTRNFDELGINVEDVPEDIDNFRGYYIPISELLHTENKKTLHDSVMYVYRTLWDLPVDRELKDSHMGKIQKFLDNHPIIRRIHLQFLPVFINVSNMMADISVEDLENSVQREGEHREGSSCVPISIIIVLALIISLGVVTAEFLTGGM
jgi:hypothetical protein